MDYMGAGFKSIHNTPNPEIDEVSFILWMEEVRIWLRDTHQIYAWVKPSHVATENTYIPNVDFIGRGSIDMTTKYDTYGDALLSALMEIKKYIKLK